VQESARQEQHVSGIDVGSPTGILAESGDCGQRRDLLAALENEGVVAKTLADPRRIGARVFVSTGQYFEQNCWSIARDGCPCAIEHLALAALDISLDEMHVHKTEIVERADLDLIGLVITKLGVGSRQAPGKVED